MPLHHSLGAGSRNLEANRIGEGRNNDNQGELESLLGVLQYRGYESINFRVFTNTPQIRLAPISYCLLLRTVATYKDWG